ncbi:MAG: TRAP transporter large permease [Planctomycetota bacterium]|nr:MAG: TRAP transporter large permease [Planctomycetota bacterium]
MSPDVIGLAGFALMLILILMGVNVAFALIALGLAGLAMLMGIGPALSSLAIISFERASAYDFAVAPLFLLMGAFVSRSDIGKEAYTMARAWVGQLRGGLAMARSVACGLFAACCGSSLASALAMGQIAYPEMKRHNYGDSLSTGIIAAGGTLGIMIPPSMGFILIGILAQLSIGKLFLAGIIPGLICVVTYMLTISILCRINPKLGPPSPKTTFKEKVGSLKYTWPVLTLFLLVIGGIYGGIFTPTEAGGVGAFGAIIISLARRQLDSAGFFECLMDTAKMSAMMMALILGAFVFNQFLAVTRIPFLASEWVVGLGLSRYAVLFIILFIYIILGLIFDVFAIMILTIPIIFPTMVAFGFNPIWYSVVMVRVIEIGLCSPPFGMNLFGLVGVVKVPIGVLYRGVIPFLLADIFNIGLLVAFPVLSTYLPEVMLSR